MNEDFILELPNWLPLKICDQVIERYDAEPNKRPGLLYGGVFDPAIKRATEVAISEIATWHDVDGLFFQNLVLAVRTYADRYPILREFALVDKGYHLKCYNPGDIFDWHCDAAQPGTASRQFIALWYLNTVDEGGATEFKYLERSVKPEAGKLVLFPSAWTHCHRGAPPVSGRKLVANCWLSMAEAT